MQQCTLCLIVDDNRVLLGMKKRGFGAGRWNGFGGKVKDESIESAAIREISEECGIKVNAENLQKVAKLDFHFSNPDVNWDQTVHVFLIKEWSGTPVESEEMKPEWFAFDKIPYEIMWSDDILWLPKVLCGKQIRGKFTFDLDNKTIKEHSIDIISNDAIL